MLLLAQHRELHIGYFESLKDKSRGKFHNSLVMRTSLAPQLVTFHDDALKTSEFQSVLTEEAGALQRVQVK